MMNECIVCHKKTNSLDNWKTCKLKCSYKYKQLEMCKSYRLEKTVKKFELALANIRKELLKKSCSNSEENRNVLAIIDEVLK